MRISLVIFIIGSLLLPWCNTITGPIDPLVISSGSGSGEWITNISSDFCGRLDSESSVNKNSIVRLPAKVWVIVLLSLLMTILSRFEKISLFFFIFIFPS